MKQIKCKRCREPCINLVRFPDCVCQSCASKDLVKVETALEFLNKVEFTEMKDLN